MTKRLLALAAVALACGIVLTGCASQNPIAGKPFGDSESLYLAPTNIEEFIEIAQDATVHIFCETEDEDLPYAGSGFQILII